MKRILNIALNRNFADVLAMDIKESNITKGEVDGFSIDLAESDTCVTSYTYKNEDDRDSDFKTLKKIIGKI